MILERLPADDPVVLHAAPARAALASYCSGDDTALNAALTGIPFRSPYRDWVQIIKALQRLPNRPEEAIKLLARVGKESAFFHLRRAADLAVLPEASFLAAISEVGKSTIRFACALRGWPPERIRMWEELERLGADPKIETLLRFMNRHRAALGSDWVRRRGLRILIKGYPAGLKGLTSAGTHRVSTEESLLLAAWHAEHREDLWDGQECWERYARYLINEESSAGDDGTRKLRIALALRRCDRVNDILSGVTPSADPADLDQLVAVQLEESLSWDPGDRDTYLRLIQYYRRGKLLKHVRRLLGQAIERWPGDMKVLEAALDTAIDAGAFKKAAGLARDVLALDPINSGVRTRLVEAHLAHARKQVIKGRPDLAHKELTAAGEWARGGHALNQIDLTAGLIALIEDTKAGAPALRDMVERLGGGLASILELALAGDALKIPSQKLFKMIGLNKPSTAGRDDLLATLARLRTHLDTGCKLSGELTTFITKALGGAPWVSLSRSESEAACDTLRRCRLHKVRLRVARAALKRWKDEPVFEFHAFEAKYPRGFSGRSDNDIYRLEIAHDRAREAGDTRTAVRINEILAGLSPLSMGPVPLGPPPAGDSFPTVDVAAISMVIETLGLDQALNMLDVPPEIRRDLKDMSRRLGNTEVAEALVSFIEMFSGFIEAEAAPPVPRPPPRRGPVPKREKSQRQTADSSDLDNDHPDQLDLF